MSEQLKPCPFCGSNDLSETHRHWNIQCNNCAAEGPWNDQFDANRAADDWNARVDQRCTCPSGDGSLRWPCPVCPPEPVAWRVVTKRRGTTRHEYTECSTFTPTEDYYDYVGQLEPLYRHPPAQAPVVQKYDDTLLPFLALMRKELHANAGKGDRPGWLQMSADTCLLEIIYHFGKLQKAVKTGDGDGMNEYAADVANMCMMLLDICGALGLSAAAAPLRKS